MSAFRRRLMAMQGKRSPVAVETADGEVIPILKLYDYELEGQVQDELYEDNGIMYLKKNIIEITLPSGQPVGMNLSVGDLWDYLKTPSNNYSYDRNYESTNAFFHIIPLNGMKTCRILWTLNNFMAGRHIGVRVYGSIVRKIGDGTYTDEEMAQAVSGATMRVATNIEEKIKVYEVKKVIYG